QAYSKSRIGVSRDPAIYVKVRTTFKQTIEANPEVLVRRTAALKRTLTNPVVRKRYSRARKRWFAKAKNRERHLAALKLSMTPEVRAKAAASLRNTLRNNPKVRARHLAHIAKLAADKDLQRRKGAKLSRTLREPGVLQQRTAAWMRTFNSP